MSTLYTASAVGWRPGVRRSGAGTYESIARSLGAVAIYNQTRDSTHWRDETTNDLDAAITGATWFPTGGPAAAIPGYLGFDGVNDRAYVGLSPLLRFGSHSFIWWQRVGANEQLDERATIMGRTPHQTRSFSTSEMNLRHIVRHATGYAEAITTTDPIVANEWQAFMVSCEEGELIRVYGVVDGVVTQHASAEFTQTLNAEETHGWVFGCDHDGTDFRRYWRGQLAGVLLFDKVVSAADFQRLHDAAGATNVPAPTPPSPSGDFNDGYETIGCEGVESFDPLDPRLKNGTRITGTAMELYYDSAMSWALNTTAYESGGINNATNIETIMSGGSSGMYGIARTGSGLFYYFSWLFRLTGDLRLLDRILDGLDALWASPYRTTAWQTEYWVNDITAWSSFSVCDYPGGPNYPWSPYNKWVQRFGTDDSAYNGTDLRFETRHMVSWLTEAAWLLHVNRNKTSPSGRDYAVEAEKWADAVVDYWRAWSEDTNECWANNYKNDRWTNGTLGYARAAWGSYPVFASRSESHTPGAEAMAHWYWGLLGLHRKTGAALDIPNPSAAIAWSREWWGICLDRAFAECTTEWGPSLVSARCWINTDDPENDEGALIRYMGHVNRNLVRSWLSGGFRTEADGVTPFMSQDWQNRHARANATAYYTGAKIGFTANSMCSNNSLHNCRLAVISGSDAAPSTQAENVRSLIGIFENPTESTRMFDSATACFDLGLRSVAGTYANPTTPLAVWQFMKKALESAGDLSW